ncbi:MAG: hypothetical protein M1819_005439 [Sarea resinae]|nr:MAG: hypothetical protein M1819_005439 [Sarea resinae]
MHSIKSRARHQAWHNDDGSPNYNPFRRPRTRTLDRNGDLESGLQQGNHHSETCLTPSIELDRNAQSERAFEAPQHASTMPTSAGTMSEKDTVASTADTGETLIGDETSPTNNKARRRLPGGEEDGEDDEIERSTTQESEVKKPVFTFASQLRATLLNSWINVLLIAAPIGIILNYVNVPPVAVFVVNFIAIIPLAALLSYATEEIALRTGETIGGLLNATFGNAVELIVSIIALVQKQELIVQTSLIGSMLSNLLLVMGMCFFFGGINRVEQHFNVTVAQTASSLLTLAVGSLVIPTAFDTWSGAGGKGDAPISRGTAVILLVVYGCYLFFQLKTHISMYNAPSEKVPKRRADGEPGNTAKAMAKSRRMLKMKPAKPKAPKKPDDEVEEPQLHIWVAVATLAISTALVALCAEYLVSSIDAITATGNISKEFVGLILLPIVGNAAEHATAVTVACKDKMDLAIGVAVGSSMQIALLVLPFIVVLGWIMGNDNMTMNFNPFQVIILFVAVLLVNYVIADGKSHWLEGVLLQAIYLLIAVAAWFYPANGDVA